MITKDNMPSSYRPFNKLVLCSNTIINCEHVISIGDVIPLIIGQGEKPLIWLQAVSEPATKKFISVIEASVPMNSAVTIFEEGDVLKVNFEKITVLQIKGNKDSSAIIDKLDLRPFGFNIFGDSGSLRAGGITLSGNTFQNLNTVLALA